jgi:hypothetical protein
MSTIKSTDISIDGTTAWLVDTPGMSVGWELRNRPCDTCLGTGFMTLGLSHDTGRPCHCIDGRRTFTLDVAAPFIPYCDVYIEPTTITVRVVAVLPIVEWGTVDLGLPHAVPCMTIDPHGNALQVDEVDIDGFSGIERQLPASAAPGMWAVELAVHT